MNDMSSVIVPKSDQLNADDLIAGPRTITITKVAIRAGQEQPVSIHFEGDNGKPWKTCKSMNRVLVAAWGADANAYIGRSVTIYRDPNVKWGGMAVGGIRISHMSHIEREMVMALTETKGKRAPHVVKPLGETAAPIDDKLTLADAKLALESAETLDQLVRRWSSKAMAPFRQALQSLLDERKAELGGDGQDTVTSDNPTASEGPTDEQPGDAFDDDTEDLSDWPAWLETFEGEMAAQGTPVDVNSLWSTQRKTLEGAPVSVVLKAERIKDARMAAVKA